MRTIMRAILLLTLLAFTSAQSVAGSCSMRCRFSSGSIECDKGKSECGCSAVKTFEGTCEATKGMHLSVNATPDQLNHFERVIENLKIDSDLVSVVEGMRNILQATKKGDSAACASATEKVDQAVKKLSQESKDKLDEQFVPSGHSGACVRADSDVSGGDCFDSDCSTYCASTSTGVSRFSRVQRDVGLQSPMLKSLIDRPPASAEECKRLFAFAMRMPLGWDRVAVEKNALTMLSRSDPEMAIQLFVKVENPQPIGEAGFPEDVRAYAAVEIFANYWKAVGIKGLDNIRQMSRHIGDTGEYPYRAMGSVMKEIIKLRHEDGRTVAAGILDEAIEYYQRGSQFLNRDEEFLALLDSARHIAPTERYLQGLRLLVGNLSTNRMSNGHFFAEIGTAEGFVRFTDMNLAILFRTFPRVAEADSRLAKRLMLLYPELRKARSKILYTAAGIVYGDATPLQLAQLQNEMLLQSLIDNISRAQKENSLEVVQMRKRLVALRSATSYEFALSADEAEAAPK